MIINYIVLSITIQYGLKNVWCHLKISVIFQIQFQNRLLKITCFFIRKYYFYVITIVSNQYRLFLLIFTFYCLIRNIHIREGREKEKDSIREIFVSESGIPMLTRGVCVD